MSKRKSWKKRRYSKPKHQYGRNRHHVLFQKRHWSSPYAKQLRLAMTREIPIKTHNILHNEVLKDVPKPSEKVLKIAYEAYLAQKSVVDGMDVCELILWLYNAIPDEAFRACMMIQYHFFDSELGGRF